MDETDSRLITAVNDNQNFIFDEIKKELELSLKIDVEMIKFGKIFSSSERKRYAFLHFTDGLFSSKTAITSSSFKPTTGSMKNKSNFILEGKVEVEAKGNNKLKWHIPNKSHRILLHYTDPKKKKESTLLLYVASELEVAF